MLGLRHVAFLAAAAALSLLACSAGGGGGSAPAAASSAAGTGTAQLAPTKQKSATVVARSGEGFLELNQGKRFLHVKGTPREMGRQYGELVGGEIEQVLQKMPLFLQAHNLPSSLTPTVLAGTAALFEQWFPPDVRDYLDGILEGNRVRNPGSSMNRDDLVFLSSCVDLAAILSGIVLCSSVAVWGDLTVDGKMFQTRCVDLFIGSGLEDHALVVLEKQDGKTPWANAGWAGLLGGASGLSAHGIGIGQVWGFSDDKAFGRPWPLTTRRIMENAVNSDEAVREFQSETLRTYGSNFVFGDKGDGRSGQPRAWALESSANYLCWFRDDDPNEDQALWNGQPYAIKIPFAVFRGDACMDPGMRSRQRASGGPSGDPRAAGAYQKRYKGQSDRVLAYKAAGTKIGAQELIELTKGVASPGGSLQCCVYANSDLELWVADSRRDVAAGANFDAFREPYVHYDMDYYLPTVEVRLDRATYVGGESQSVTVDTSTMGKDRDLWLSFEIEGPGGATLAHSNVQGPLPASFRAGAPQTRTLSLELPQGIPGGRYRVVATLTERGTADLVDLAIAEFDVP